MTAREFVASMEARAASLSPKQRRCLCAVADRMVDAGTVALAREDMTRRETERRWEEQQLSGPHLERRRREPA
jgi:hypothetical protein